MPSSSRCHGGGVSLEGKQTLYALDARTGEVAWSENKDVTGTFLSYSEEHDVVVLSGSRYRDRAPDEHGEGMAAFRGKDGKQLWKNDLSYGGPTLLWRDRILTNGSGGFAVDLKTGKPTGWDYGRTYGCNTAIGSEHLLTFRSGAAGFFDLSGDSGTGNLGGFRSSCTANLIVAGGVLNAPDYTRTCRCAYQNQTSLALVHMPEAEFWTFGGRARKGRTGVNFGAPGDRRDADGTLWVDFPNVGGPSEEVSVEVEPKDAGVFRIHSSLVTGDGLKWVAASGLRGARRIRIGVEGEMKVRLHFMEPEDVAPGGRVFDVAIQGRPVLKGFDVAGETGGSRRPVVKEFTASPSEGRIVIDLIPKTDRLPVLSGVELIVTNR